MSSVSDDYSDDDVPLASQSRNGSQRQIASTNGKRTIDSDHDDSSLSDDDMPLSEATHPTPSSSSRGFKRKKETSESSSEDDVPLASSPPKKRVNGAAAKPRKVKVEDSDDDEDSVHLNGTKTRAPTNGKAKKPPKKKIKESSDDGKPSAPKKAAGSRKRKLKAEEEDEDAMLVDQPKKPKAKPRSKKVKQEEASDTETPQPKKRTSKASKKGEGEEASQTKGKKKEKEEEEAEVYRWWDSENPNGDGTIKWQTLEHNGLIFPPPYEPLPSHVKMKYDGKELRLPPASEEVAGFFAAMLETDHAKDATFQKNFFEDWKKVLKMYPPQNNINVTDFALCDFRPMFEYFEAEKAKKKALSAAEKKELKKAKEEMEAKYMTCLLDGRKEKVGNFRVEPPGLFRGRGEHPKKGALKFRVRPEDITVNIGAGVPIPVPNVPGQWKSIIHDNTVTWLANWIENVNGNHKYVFLAAGSTLKSQSDMQKFEKARELKDHVDRIRQNYTRDLKSKIMAERQRATAMYFIDKLALRAGNEKGEDEADTVGCCSLRCEHVTLESPDYIIFDFLGKDSIRYYNRVQVDAQIFKNIRIFKENKNEDDNLFDRVTTGSLNKHLTSEMKGLTAKVFRTFNASITFQRLLDEEKDKLEGASLQEKLNAYNKANRWVAILCNHQRSVPKTHDQTMEKMRNKHRAFKYERMKLRHALFVVEPKLKKNKKYVDDESDLDDEWIAEHEEGLKAKEIEKAEKKFAKDNEKLEEEGKKPNKDSVLNERIEAIEEEFKRLTKERGTGKASLKRDRPTEKIEEAIAKLTEKIKSFKLQIVDRDAGKEVALGTSKINYLDPRITAAWCKAHDVPIEKIFSKTLLTKFPWAMEADTEWKF
ncbi:DNA topoisomerase I [Amanita rubescens]|nr:DNA topoisomerase I [Amanita rubescens]